MAGGSHVMRLPVVSVWQHFPGSFTLIHTQIHKSHMTATWPQQSSCDNKCVSRPTSCPVSPTRRLMWLTFLDIQCMFLLVGLCNYQYIKLVFLCKNGIQVENENVYFYHAEEACSFSSHCISWTAKIKRNPDVYDNNAMLLVQIISSVILRCLIVITLNVLPALVVQHNHLISPQNQIDQQIYELRKRNTQNK